MSTWIRVARCQLTDRYVYVWTWAGPALIFLVNLTLAANGVGARQGAGSFRSSPLPSSSRPGR